MFYCEKFDIFSTVRDVSLFREGGGSYLKDKILPKTPSFSQNFSNL